PRLTRRARSPDPFPQLQLHPRAEDRAHRGLSAITREVAPVLGRARSGAPQTGVRLARLLDPPVRTEDGCLVRAGASVGIRRRDSRSILQRAGDHPGSGSRRSSLNDHEREPVGLTCGGSLATKLRPAARGVARMTFDQRWKASLRCAALALTMTAVIARG